MLAGERGGGPPRIEIGVAVWRVSGEPAPGEELMPNHLREDTFRQDVLHGLGILVAKEACRRMRKAMASTPGLSSAAVEPS